jgi:RNA polymerase-binding transcription factor DksA
MAPANVDQHVSALLPAHPHGDLAWWRNRLERLWRLQVEQVIELSLAYHEASSARRMDGSTEPPGAGRRQLRPILTRAVVAHQSLAEIEAALARIGSGCYGVCEQCGVRLPTSWLDASPQIRYCPSCNAASPVRPGTAAGAP